VLFQPLVLDQHETDVLGTIDQLKDSLKLQLYEPRRWQGSLRRLSIAKNMQGSNSIEGFDALLDDAAAVALGEQPLDATTETRLALEGYQRAMTYVLQLAQEPPIEYSEQLIKSLHFMMTAYDLANRPGRWRAGAIYVHNEDTGEMVYEGADIDLVPDLINEFVAGLQAGRDCPAILEAAMAHLNLVMIHPFRDGNGRMARCLQSLVLAANGTLAPVFMSIEEYLGRNTHAYYDILAEVGGGSWQPARAVRPWVRFILTAHLRQARTLQRRVKESERTWYALERLVAAHALPDRLLATLFDASLGLRVRNATHRAVVAIDEDITEQTASRDLRLAVEAGLLIPRGEKRGRHYVRGGALGQIRQDIVSGRKATDMADPFEGRSG
jgi:Fic family protein